MIIPDGFAQANFQFVGTGAPEGAEVTLGLDVQAYAGDPTDAALDCANAWNVSFATQQSSSITFTNVHVKFGPGNTGASGDSPGGGACAGNAAAVPPQVSVIMNKATALGGRSGRGRMFIPGLPEGLVNPAGVIDGTTIANWNAAAEDFVDALTTALLGPVLLHGPDSPLTVPTPLTSITTSSKVGTQRDRLRR